MQVVGVLRTAEMAEPAAAAADNGSVTGQVG